MIIAFIMSAVEDIGTVTGLGQHQLNIVKGLMELSLGDKYVFVVNELVAEQLHDLYPNIKTYSYGKQFKLPRMFEKFYYFLNMWFLNQFIVPKAVRHIEPTIVFQPYNCITIRTRWKYPYALMVLDLYHRFFPDYMKKAKFRLTQKKHDAMMKNAGLIVTSSTENKNHFKEFYPEFLSKVRVVPVPIDIDTSDYEKFEVKKPYILCVNSLRYHKNIHTLVKAFNLIKDRIEHNLILIGNSEWDEVDNISTGSDRIIFTGYISSAQRNYLYENTDLFVSPTMFEGFGMTPLEAMLFERKVLVSDIPVMRESTLGLAEYFGDIENEEILAGRILEVLEMEYPEGRLSAIKGRILEEYNPRTIADKIHSCLIGLVEADEDSN